MTISPITANSDLDFLTHPPDSAKVGVVLVFVRAASYALSTNGFAWAAADENELKMLAWTLVFLGTALWSVWRTLAMNRRNRRASIQSAVLSAEATVATGQPVAVVVTDPGH